MQYELFKCSEYQSEEKFIGEGKVCIACNRYKPFYHFSKHIGHKDNHDGRCRECVNSQVRLRKALKAQAPPKPSICECCGKQSSDIVLDHCHEKKEFRGGVCRFCNAGIGLLQDNIDGVEKALTYLKGYYNKRNTSETRTRSQGIHGHKD